MTKATSSQPEKEFAGWVEEALRLNRKKLLVELARLELASSSLVEGCFLAGEEIDERSRGQVVQALLRWGVEQLRPDGEPSWTDKRWFPYHVLFYAYFERIRPMTFEEMAEALDISVSVIYQHWRPKAIEALTKLLGKELEAPQALEQRRGYAIRARYEAHLPHEQAILRMAAIFRRPFALSLLHEMAQKADLPEREQAIANLVQANLLRSHQEGSLIERHPDVRPYLLPLLSPAERLNWHQEAAESYEAEEDYLEAAYHWRMRGDAQADERAAEMLIEHQQRIIDRLESGSLLDMLMSIELHDISPALWVEVKLLSGDLAAQAKELQVAIEEYGQALAARNVQTQAKAYYKRAKAFRQINLDEAQAHFEEAIRLLAESCPQDNSLLPIYIDFAWFLIHERPNHEQAEAILRGAEAIMGDNRVRWARLHNAWAGLYAKKGDKERIISHRSRALMYAEQAQNVELMMKTAKNLGYDYAELRQDYQNALKYMKLSLELARQSGDKQMQADCYKAIGSTYFWQEAYEKASQEYRKAYEIYVETGNQNRQIVTCYDLTEAYAELGNIAQMQHVYKQGRNLAQKIGHADYQAAFNKLPRHYPELDPTLNPRQLQAFHHIRQHGQITNRAYRELTGVSSKQAVRDLKELLCKELLARKGAGASTHYTFPAAS
jgi:tetratricopeptide (TPR) repeat protein